MLDAAMFVGTATPEGALWQLHSFALATVLAGGAGIRATVPLFLLSLVHLLFPESVPLSGESEWLGYWFICAGLGILLIVEVLADTIPAVDHALHTVLTPVYPVAGALAAASPDYGGGVASHLVMAVCGAGLALIFHGGKSASRVGTTAAAGGVLTPLSSTAGTAGLISVVLAAMFLGVLCIIIALGVICLAVYIVLFVRRVSQERQFRMGDAGVVAIAAQRFRRLIRRQPEQTSSQAAPGGTSFADMGQALHQCPPQQPASAPRPEQNGV